MMSAKPADTQDPDDQIRILRKLIDEGDESGPAKNFDPTAYLHSLRLERKGEPLS